MILKACNFLRRFRKDEDGQAVVEFVLGVPIMFFLFFSSVEMSVYAMRQNWLDRGLDMAVRDIRLDTGGGLTHDDVKSRICTYAGALPNCETFLRLEMNPINASSFAGFGGDADCVDRSLPVTPSVNFVHGGNHQLMLMRACYTFKPVFPGAGQGRSFTKDSEGRVMMTSMSAFVQEPT